jgi:hypothetical protein
MNGTTNLENNRRSSKSELSDLLCVTIEGGKYTIKQGPTGGLRALRYGEEWRDLCGDSMVLCMAQEIERLRTLVDLARDTYIEENSDGETDCVTPYDRYT